MNFKTIIITLLWVCFFCKSAQAQDKEMDFSFEVEINESEVALRSLKGTFWNELTSYNILTKTHYIGNSGISSKRNDTTEQDFLIKIQLKGEEAIFEGIQGTLWDEKKFDCPDQNCKFTVTHLEIEAISSQRDAKLASIQDKINELEEKKELIKKEEKEKLKAEIEKINSNEDFKGLSEASIDSLKMEMAEKTAKNIDNQIAIIENSIEYLKRNLEEIDFTEEKTSGESKLNINLGGWNLVSVSEVVDKKPTSKICRSTRKRQPLTSENQALVKSYPKDADDFLVIAVAFNNALPDGGSLNNTGIRFAGSRTFEIGYARDFRVFEKSNWLRIKYGASLQFNGLKPEGNRIFVKDGNQTNIEEFDFNLRKNKFRMDNLIIPVHLQFGKSKAYVNEDTGRVSFKDHNFKFGIGGFVGLNLLNTQKLRYTNDLGIRIRERQRDDFNTNNFLYGLSAYVGWESFSVFAQYNLNPIFRDNPMDMNNFQIGIRLDLN